MYLCLAFLILYSDKYAKYILLSHCKRPIKKYINFRQILQEKRCQWKMIERKKLKYSHNDLYSRIGQQNFLIGIL